VSGGKAWALANSPTSASAYIDCVPKRLQGAGIREVIPTLTFPEPPPGAFRAAHLIGRKPLRVELGEVLMLEFLAYVVFFVLMFGCLLYIMSSLETEEAPRDRGQ
jgi:hypothetical protein